MNRGEALKSRDHQIDNIKGLLIILVVFGHMLLASTKENNEVLTLIYSFHMPAFIFINGLFSKNVNLKKVFRFGILYIVIQLIYILVVRLTSYPWIPTTHIIATPIFHVWYLLSLTYWYLFIFFVKKYKLKPILVISVSTIFALLIRYNNFHVDGNYFAYARTIVFAPYFMVGHFLTLKDIEKARVKLRKTKLLLLFLIFVFLFVNFQCFGKNANEWMKMFFGYINFQQFSDSKYVFLLKELFQYIIGIVAIIGMLGLISDRKSFLNYLGQHTLSIFICHPIIYFVVYNHINRNSITTFESFLYSVILTILAIIFSLMIEIIANKIRCHSKGSN